MRRRAYILVFAGLLLGGAALYYFVGNREKTLAVKLD